MMAGSSVRAWLRQEVLVPRSVLVWSAVSSLMAVALIFGLLLSCR